MAHTVNPFLDEGGDIRNTLNDWVHKTHGWQRPLWLTNDEAAYFVIEFECTLRPGQGISTTEYH